MTLDGALNKLLRLLLPAAALAAAALAVVAVLDRLALDSQAAARRALMARSEQLTASALTPGSALSCLDSGAGETAEAACEASVFASPQSTAAAVAYIGARLTLLADAKVLNLTIEAADSFSGLRRALELDRYGIAAHVLAARDGCTPERCPAFALLSDTNALKANMKAQAFDQYVSRHAAAWNAPAAPVEPAAAVSAAPPAAQPAPPLKATAAEPVAHPVSSKYTLPSAASIPPVSIMNAEPALPKGAAEAQGSQPKVEGKVEGKPEDDVPMPPKRPQAQAVTPPAVR